MREGDGYSLTWPTGEQWRFGAEGNLEALESPYGATVTVKKTGDTLVLLSSQGVMLTARFAEGRVASIEANDGRRVEYGYAEALLVDVDAPGLDLAYRYDVAGRLTESSAASGTTAVVYTDGLVTQHRTAIGQRFVLRYDGSTTTVSSNGPDATFEHDPVGRLTRVSVGGNDTMKQDFDADGRVVLRTEYAVPGGDVVTSVERTYDGSRLTSETIDGATSEYQYDERGRVTEIVGPVPASFEYRAETPLPVAITTQNGGRSEVVYGDGFVTAVTTATGATTFTRRDALGNSIATGLTVDSLWVFDFDSEGNVTSTTSPSGRTWSSEWGPRAVLLQERDPIGRVITYSYEVGGRLARESRPGGWTAHRTYNRDGRLATVVGPDGFATRYEYDPNGRIHTIVEPGDRTWRVGYDDWPDGSQTVTTTAPDGSSTAALIDSSVREIVR